MLEKGRMHQPAHSAAVVSTVELGMSSCALWTVEQMHQKMPSNRSAVLKLQPEMTAGEDE